jgi:phosphatidylglycerol:prolipoprotein diacylglycerol transferase
MSERLPYIEFPKLGIHLEINPVLFQVGPFTVHWYGIITALAFLVIILGVMRKSERFGLKQDDLVDMMLFTAPIGIVGARLFYVLVNWKMYAGNPVDILKIWEGGLAIYGGIILGIVTIFLFCRARKINPFQLLDHLVVYLALGQSIGRWGNFVNQELFGPATDLPWGMTGSVIQRTETEPVHPLFLYESLWSLTAFFILLWFRKRKKLQGEVFSLYMVSYGCARLVIDSMRSDLRIGNVNMNQVIGGLFALAFITVFICRRLRLKKLSTEEAPYQPSQYREILDNIEQEPTESPSPVPTDTAQGEEKPEAAPSGDGIPEQDTGMEKEEP